MHLKECLVFLLLCSISLQSQTQVTTVDFLKEYNLDYNASGPILTAVDSVHNRIAVLHANSSMVSIINGYNDQVQNIPIQSRGIQHFKDEALTIDQTSGVVYALGNKSLHLVFPLQGKSKTFATQKQYEMVAVDELTGNAFLVGRASKEMAFLNLKKEVIQYIPWADREESLLNLNQTPPPPIRKVICDWKLNQVLVVDGFTAQLLIFDAKNGRTLIRRDLELVSGGRWHYAGYNRSTHHLYLVIENDKRQVLQAAKIDIRGNNDRIVELPKFTEGVGITYNPKRDEIYIPYDNHPSVHVVDFRNGGQLEEIKLPLYGNDASAIDEENDRLYIASWAYGEIEVIDLETRRFLERIPDLGILPHTFNLSLLPGNKKLYIPIGATAVNGVFGSALTVIDPVTKHVEKVYTGWAPRELIQLPGSDEFLVFNAEDQFAHVKPDGRYQIHKLPFDYPHQAVHTGKGNIYLSYGPHQSYWPSVYIWGAQNGLLHIDAKTLQIWDRRMPRLSQGMAVDKNGILYCLQNSWGKEKQFISVFADEIREWEAAKRLVPDAEIERETIQRVLRYDPQQDRLYLLKVGEQDDQPGRLQIVSTKKGTAHQDIEVGLNPTDLIWDDQAIYVSNFDSHTLTRISQSDGEQSEIKTGRHPLKLTRLNEAIFILNHGDGTLQRWDGQSQFFPIPVPGQPDNLAVYGNQLIITSHSAQQFHVLLFDPASGTFQLLMEYDYPYGETSFASNNSAFYLSGQFGDALYEISKIKSDNEGRLWITDFLSGKLFILSDFDQ